MPGVWVWPRALGRVYGAAALTESQVNNDMWQNDWRTSTITNTVSTSTATATTTTDTNPAFLHRRIDSKPCVSAALSHDRAITDRISLWHCRSLTGWPTDFDLFRRVAHARLAALIKAGSDVDVTELSTALGEASDRLGVAEAKVNELSTKVMAAVPSSPSRIVPPGRRTNLVGSAAVLASSSTKNPTSSKTSLAGAKVSEAQLPQQ